MMYTPGVPIVCYSRNKNWLKGWIAPDRYFLFSGLLITFFASFMQMHERAECHMVFRLMITA